MIKQITKQDDFVVLSKLLNIAFATVARDFGLTKQNNPTNSAFITSDELKAQLTEYREFYKYMDNGKPIGFVAIEKSLDTSDTFYIEKLSVIPDYRHLGTGKRLMDFASNRIMELKGKRISIGLINSNIVLKNWYGKLGYVEYAIKTFEHLPFEVCLMEKNFNFPASNFLQIRFAENEVFKANRFKKFGKLQENFETIKFL
jgi:ribosomal protein S18 acetylase RimI-like enzyme